jgi:hypothetical protein
MARKILEKLKENSKNNKRWNQSGDKITSPHIICI